MNRRELIKASLAIMGLSMLDPLPRLMAPNKKREPPKLKPTLKIGKTMDSLETTSYLFQTKRQSIGLKPGSYWNLGTVTHVNFAYNPFVINEWTGEYVCGKFAECDVTVGITDINYPDVHGLFNTFFRQSHSYRFGFMCSRPAMIESSVLNNQYELSVLVMTLYQVTLSEAVYFPKQLPKELEFHFAAWPCHNEPYNGDIGSLYIA